MTKNGPEDIFAVPEAPGADHALELTDYCWEERLACPFCAARLNQTAEELWCSTCQKTWIIVNRVPAFVERVPYRGDIPRETMLKVNALIRHKHWRTILLESDDPSIRKVSDSILNPDSGNWHWLTGLGPQSRVLDLEAGIGTLSHALANRFSEVFALEPTRERIDFMQQRFAQDGIRNVRIVRASPWEIPFPPRSFDLIVMNGTLPWIATNRAGNPQTLQIEVLKRARQLLVPGGCLYLAIENRIRCQYFVGAADPHCGLPYVAVLPRPLANWYAKRRGHAGGYRNYTYSVRGYRKILAAAGFKNIQFYLAIPDWKSPRLYLPLRENIFSYYHKNFDPLRSGILASVASRILSSLGILKYLQDSFVILARVVS